LLLIVFLVFIAFGVCRALSAHHVLGVVVLIVRLVLCNVWCSQFLVFWSFGVIVLL
jgi:hypothetical protein